MKRKIYARDLNRQVSRGVLHHMTLVFRRRFRSREMSETGRGKTTSKTSTIVSTTNRDEVSPRSKNHEGKRRRPVTVHSEHRTPAGVVRSRVVETEEKTTRARGAFRGKQRNETKNKSPTRVIITHAEALSSRRERQWVGRSRRSLSSRVVPGASFKSLGIAPQNRSYICSHEPIIIIFRAPSSSSARQKGDAAAAVRPT